MVPVPDRLRSETTVLLCSLAQVATGVLPLWAGQSATGTALGLLPLTNVGQPAPASKAVFLSYAAQDANAARVWRTNTSVTSEKAISKLVLEESGTEGSDAAV